MTGLYKTMTTDLLRKLHDDSFSPLIKLILGVFLLLLQCGHHVCVWTLLPVVQTVDLRKKHISI